jgi:catechol 2,3-dioxygenase-like lactoylglutathione lyase family enzyme
MNKEDSMRYAHTNIAARDWKRLAEFYIEVFECVIKPPERNLSGEWLDLATGLTGASLQGVHLLLPGHGDGGPTLEIFTYGEMHHGDPLMANHTGFTHVAFEIDDFDATYARALSMGAEELGQPTERVIEGVGTLKFVYFRDPEGNIVEIQAWLK